MIGDSASAVLRRHRRPLMLLNDTERDRAARFRGEADRMDFIAAHVAAREAVADLIGIAVAAVSLAQECGTCKSQTHGPPSVSVPGYPPGLVRVSWSHSGGYIAAVAATRTVGIDVEPRARRMPNAAVLASVLTAAERAQVQASADPPLAFFRLWTAKEALVKTGRISIRELRGVELAAAPSSWQNIRLRTWQDAQTVISLAVV
jgi:4'-phosphopantetheinyl transferase